MSELVAGDPEAIEAARRLRRALQERYRRDGATEMLDERSPNGFRLFAAPSPPELHASDPAVRHRRRLWQYARWIRHLPEGWTPPPPSAAGVIPPRPAAALGSHRLHLGGDDRSVATQARPVREPVTS